MSLKSHFEKICFSVLTVGMLMSSLVFALPLQLSYQGRMTETNGKPVEGPISMEVGFYRLDVDGDPVIPAISISDVKLKEGVFQVNLNLAPSDWHKVFPDNSG